MKQKISVHRLRDWWESLSYADMQRAYDALAVPIPTTEISIRLKVAELEDGDEANEWAASLVDHILETFNDDLSIKLCTYDRQPRS